MNERLPNPPKVEIYKDKSAEGDCWRWRFRAGNGQIVASSSEAYSSKGNAKRSWIDMEEYIQTYAFVIEDFDPGASKS